MCGCTKGISQCLWKPTAHFLCIINRNPHSLLEKGLKKTNIIKSKHPELPWSRCLWSFAQTHKQTRPPTCKCRNTRTQIHTIKPPVVHVDPHCDGAAGSPQWGISAAAGVALGSGTPWLLALCLRLSARGPCCQELSLKATGEGLSNSRGMMSPVCTPCRGAASQDRGLHILTNIFWGVKFYFSRCKHMSPSFIQYLPAALHFTWGEL